MRPNCPERLSCPSITPVFRELPATAPIARPAPAEFDLPGGALWSTEPHRAMEIRCEDGQLWVTQAGNERDVVLLAGETFVPAPKGRVVVQALTHSRLRVADETRRT